VTFLDKIDEGIANLKEEKGRLASQKYARRESDREEINRQIAEVDIEIKNLEEYRRVHGKKDTAGRRTN
jgi:hypothetical protein